MSEHRTTSDLHAHHHVHHHMHHEHDLCGHDHAHTLYDELICHIPYAAFSLAIGFVVLGIMDFFSAMAPTQAPLAGAYHVLFHAFHYLHLLFATAGTTVMFFRFSGRVALGVTVSLLIPAIFCTLSDVVLPSLAGFLLGVDMEMHVCFFSLHDTLNLLPFMIIGVIVGLALLRGDRRSLQSFALNAHFFHILISSLASLFYMVSQGFGAWHEDMGFLFFFLFIAVVVPCTFSDVMVPLYFARSHTPELDATCDGHAH